MGEVPFWATAGEASTIDAAIARARGFGMAEKYRRPDAIGEVSWNRETTAGYGPYRVELSLSGAYTYARDSRRRPLAQPAGAGRSVPTASSRRSRQHIRHLEGGRS